MPLAEHGRCIASLLQGLREGDFVQRQPGDVIDRPQWPAAPIESLDTAHGVNAGARTVLATQKCGPCRLAIRSGGITAGETHALRGEAIYIGRFVILAAVTAEIGVAEIVGQ